MYSIRSDQWVQVIVPIAALLACVCGVVLILGFISNGVLSGLSVFIPCAVLGGISVILIVVGTIASTNCAGREEVHRTVSSSGQRRRRRDHLSTRQRMEIVSRLTRVEHTNGATLDEEKTCSICLSEDPPERVMLNCGHLYHEGCVKEWLRRARFARCPLCRTGLDAAPSTDEANPNTLDEIV